MPRLEASEEELVRAADFLVNGIAMTRQEVDALRAIMQQADRRIDYLTRGLAECEALLRRIQVAEAVHRHTGPIQAVAPQQPMTHSIAVPMPKIEETEEQRLRREARERRRQTGPIAT